MSDRAEDAREEAAVGYRRVELNNTIRQQMQAARDVAFEEQQREESGWWWQCGIYPGLTVYDTAPELRSDQCSAWRTLEGVWGGVVEWVKVRAGRYEARLEGRGYKMTTGTASFHRRELSGGRATTRDYQWTRREEERRWLWVIVAPWGVWQVEAPPGEEMCPDPEMVAAPEQQNPVDVEVAEHGDSSRP